MGFLALDFLDAFDFDMVDLHFSIERRLELTMVEMERLELSK
jgi:hypothetical protein